jgi:hypothetical protein
MLPLERVFRHLDGEARTWPKPSLDGGRPPPAARSGLLKPH